MLSTKRKARDGGHRSGFVSVQLRFNSKLTLEDYLSQQAWRSATLPSCPIDGAECRPARHGCYWRKFPQPVPIARFYCARAQTTFSLLPDFLASRYRGTLNEFEQVCVAAESTDALAICNGIRPLDVTVSISARSAQRWVARRIVLFRITLLALLGVAVERLHGVQTATHLRERLGCVDALVALRALASRNLASLPPPLGFGPWPKTLRRTPTPRQQAMAPEVEPPSG